MYESTRTVKFCKKLKKKLPAKPFFAQKEKKMYYKKEKWPAKLIDFISQAIETNYIWSLISKHEILI